MNNIRKLLNKKWVIIFAFILGICLILYGSSVNKKAENTTTAENKNDEIYYTEYIEEKLEMFLKSIDGVSDASVFVTVDGGRESEFAKMGNSNGYATDYLVIDTDNGKEAAIVRQIYPKIRGVAVSCTNGDNAEVKEKITSLLGAALGINTNKIMVTEYKTQS